MKGPFSKTTYVVFAFVLIFSMLLSACAQATPKPADNSTAPTQAAPTAGQTEPTKAAPEAAPTATAAKAQPAAQGRMTEQGTPRSETLIMNDGRNEIVGQYNPYMVGTPYGQGFHTICMANLFEIDGVKGDMIPWLAAKPSEPLNADFTQWRTTIRQGLTWDDGTEFTTDDIAFTMNTLLTNDKMTQNGYWKGIVKELKVVDKYTFETTTLTPYPRFDRLIGQPGWDGAFHILPKHVWEKQDPTKFKANPPVCLDAYKYVKADPQGNWTLWQRRDDWQKSPTGVVLGQPGPKYVLYKAYGPEEKKVLASIQHDLDVFDPSLSPEGWEALTKQNKYASSWFKNFPYAFEDDGCMRGLVINNAESPYDKSEVRWALALATDIQSVSLSTFGGKLRYANLIVPSTPITQETYYFPLESWLKDFTLPTGFKPYDPDAAAKLVKTLTDQGVQNLPTDPMEQKKIFGVGWWKYAPDEAAKLLESVGFKKDGSGKWLLPDGKPWKMTVSVLNNDPESQGLAFAAVDQWKQFGIDAVAQAQEPNQIWTNNGLGKFDINTTWPGCGLWVDVQPELSGWHEKFVKPIGEQPNGNSVRFKNAELSKLLDQIEGMKSTDPKLPETIREIMKIFVKEMPVIQFFNTSMFVPVDTFYWEGWPSKDNYYFGPWWWWADFRFVLPHLKPTGRQ